MDWNGCRIVAEKQRFEMIWQIAVLLISSVSMYLIFLFTKNVYAVLLAFGVSTTVLYLVHLWYTMKLANGGKKGRVHHG